MAPPSTLQSTPFDLPGLTLPLNFKPKDGNNRVVYPNALDGQDINDGYIGSMFTVRELLMMRIMEAITDKLNWDEKVFNEEITNKWQTEITQSGQDVTPSMIDYILKELRWKTEEYKKTGILKAYDPGVVKSDTAISPALQQQLRDAVLPLEDVPENEKDYHPRSDMKVVDLVHPSLFPLIYGRTRVLRDKLTGVGDCFFSVGQGELIKIQDEVQEHNYWRHGPDPYSKKFQWLPSDVQFNADGKCRISSYINNLHPAKHRDLYHTIETILDRAIPLWNISLSRDYRPHRIEFNEVEYLDGEPEPERENDEDWDNEDYWERHQQWQDSRPLKFPEPDEFKPPSPNAYRGAVDLQTKYRDKGLQVIVKLANIELTPDKPDYEGGSWHIEGQLNERICATAIYYYDSENITDNTLSFRHRGDHYSFDDVSYEQGQFQFLQVFGFDADAGNYDGTDITQELGGVLCREGRLLTFPNTLQHRVSPFSLADRSKPGHRKILALFLIDPGRRIISTANVPPQREDWCNEWRKATHDVLAPRLPVELQRMVHDDIDFTPMTMDEAKAYRLELMDERSLASNAQNEAFETGGFSLCEH